MTSAIISKSTLHTRLLPSCGPQKQRTLAGLSVGTRVAAVVRRLQDLAPYALMELILPGGSVMALLLWLYRRQ
jgi:hypothetical protein